MAGTVEHGSSQRVRVCACRRVRAFLFAFCTLFTLFTSMRSSSAFRILLILGCMQPGRHNMSRQAPSEQGGRRAQAMGTSGLNLAALCSPHVSRQGRGRGCHPPHPPHAPHPPAAGWCAASCRGSRCLHHTTDGATTCRFLACALLGSKHRQQSQPFPHEPPPQL